MLGRRTKSVLLVDFDNIAAQLGHNDFVGSIPRWLAWLEDGRFDPEHGKRSFMVKWMYWNRPAEVYREAVEAQDFEALVCPSRVKGKKSQADMVIAVDALRSAYENERMQECIILAVDTDYEPLIDALKDCGLRTVIAATPGIAMEVYSECADVVIPIEALHDAMAYERQRSLMERLRDKLRGWRKLARRRNRLAVAAALLIEIGKQSPGQTIAKKAVMKALEEKFPIQHRGRGAYLSCGNYDTMLERIAAQSEELYLHEYDERRRAIAWRSPRTQRVTTARTSPVTGQVTRPVTGPTTRRSSTGYATRKKRAPPRKRWFFRWG
ncbi:MAG TPA: NYN domain-containing protein [Hyphomicrobiaceae bacterium]|nr:NYN domain-containing protein [Hyphomicrobiaceae bacterium]